MPANRQACELLHELELKGAEVAEKLATIRDTIRKILETKGKVKYGIINILDTLGAEVLAAASAIASTVADEVVGNVSKIASNLLEAVINELLKILLAHPDTIFSLVAIPHQAAVTASSNERIHLNRAQQDIAYILYITRKWSKGFNGRRFYDQMNNAGPFIEKAIEQSFDLVKSLKGATIEAGEAPNAFFDESKYKSIQDNIRIAIAITFPDSIANDKFQITKQIEDSQDRKYRKLSGPIQLDYTKRKKALDLQYFKDVQEIQGAVNNPNATIVHDNISAIKLDILVRKYSFRKNTLDLELKERLALARIKAATEAAIDGSNYVKVVKNTTSEFINDIETMSERLFSLVNNLKSAKSAYDDTQEYSNVVYRMRDLIRNLINEMVNIIRRTGNRTAETLIRVIDAAQANMFVVQDQFDDAIERFIKPDLKISSSEMSSTVAFGHGVLTGADASLHATITQSLIDLINADDVLEAGNKEFDDFLAKLSEIPDWDGITNVWAVDLDAAALSPYIQLIADATTLAVKIPASVATKNNDEGNRRIIALMNSVNTIFDRVKRHNSIVSITLNSYEPYMSPEGGQLIAILSRVGLLDSFAKTMSIANIASTLITNVVKNGLDSTIPNYTNCASQYPDLFDTPETAQAFAISNNDIPTPQFDMTWQQNLENDMDGIIKTREYVNNNNIITNIDQNDLISPPPNTTIVR